MKMEYPDFKVDVCDSRYGTSNQAELSVTHNGHQWTTINIYNPEKEIPQILEALHLYYDTMKPTDQGENG